MERCGGWDLRANGFRILRRRRNELWDWGGAEVALRIGHGIICYEGMF
jgi:hypothetical protein